MQRIAFPSVIVLLVLGILARIAAVRAELLDDTLVAQSHLRALGITLQIYLNDNRERLDDPIRLWESGDISDPLFFWHPGDSDPSPVTLDNSVMNAPNSTQISFEFRTGDLAVPPDYPLIWDNDAANNDGLFISYLTADGAIETDPPNVSPVPTNVVITHAHLRRLWWMLHLYSWLNNGVLPEDLSEAHAHDGVLSPRNFWNPGDADPMPTEISTDKPNAPNSARVSFDYPVAGMQWNDLPMDTIVLLDNSADNNAGYGVNVLDRRGFVRFVPLGMLGDASGDGDVDLEDWAKLQNCYTHWFGLPILDYTCRVLDWEGRDRITWNDHAEFVQVLADPQP